MYVALSSDLLYMLYLSLYGLGWFVERHGPAVAVYCRVVAAVGASFASVRKESIYKDRVLQASGRRVYIKIVFCKHQEGEYI